jgi:regulator of replication initiation timing
VKIRNKQKDERGLCDLELIIEKLKKENYDLKKQVDYAEEEIQLKEIEINKLKEKLDE